MAKFDIHGIDEFMKEISQLDLDRIAPKMLE